MMIVVTTPTGNIGGQVLARLLDSAEAVRVIVRDPARVDARVRDRVEIVEGSHADAGIVAKAFAGADSLFWLPPGDPTVQDAHTAYVEFSRPAAQALAGSGIGRVVAVSALGRGWPSYAGQVTATLEADDLFAATGRLPRARVRLTDGEHPAPARVDQDRWRDLRAVRRRAEGHGGRDRRSGVEEVPLKGPEAISPDQMAETMSHVLGRPVRFQQAAIATLRAAMMAQGASAGMADATVALIKAKGQGLDDMVPGPTPSLTPTTFARWCRTVLLPAVGR